MTENANPAPDDEIKLAPPDPEIDLIREMSVAQPYLPGVSPVEEPEKYQFKIWHLMLVTLIVAMTVAIMEWTSAKFVAGIVGAITLLSLIWMRRHADTHPRLNMLFAVIFLIYLTLAISLTARFALGF